MTQPDAPPPQNPSPYPPQMLGYQSGTEMPRISGVAIAALVVGILAVVLGCFIPGILGIAAIILGAVGISQTRAPNVKGRGMAIAGLVCGVFSLLYILLLLISILMPSLGRAREAANRVKCATNLRQIGQAARQYAIDDPEGRFPPDLETLYTATTATMTLSTEIWVCPTSTATPAKPPFVLGQNLSYVYLGAGLTEDAPATAVAAHCELHNHGDGTNVLYRDGSVRFELSGQLPAGVQPTSAPRDPAQP